MGLESLEKIIGVVPSAILSPEGCAFDMPVCNWMVMPMEKHH